MYKFFVEIDGSFIVEAETTEEAEKKMKQFLKKIKVPTGFTKEYWDIDNIHASNVSWL